MFLCRTYYTLLRAAITSFWRDHFWSDVLENRWRTYECVPLCDFSCVVFFVFLGGALFLLQIQNAYKKKFIHFAVTSYINDSWCVNSGSLRYLSWCVNFLHLIFTYHYHNTHSTNEHEWQKKIEAWIKQYNMKEHRIDAWIYEVFVLFQLKFILRPLERPSLSSK